MVSVFDKEELNKYIIKTIHDKDYELEMIYGINNSIKIKREQFLRLMNKYKELFNDYEITNTLDITFNSQDFRDLRLTINDINNIMKYCKEDNYRNISPEHYSMILKSRINEFPPIFENEYNLRFNLKQEKKDIPEEMIQVLNEKYESLEKSFRYKRRYSFLTKNKLFRIDLTVLKGSGYKKFYKTFKSSHVLEKSEKYEIEVEFIGNQNDNIDFIYHSIITNDLINYKDTDGGIYNPLNISKMDHDDSDEMEYDDIYSPRLNDGNNLATIDRNQSIIGKYVRIKEEYFNENTQYGDMYLQLQGYYKDNIPIGYIISSVDDIIKISIQPSINDISEMDVPKEYLYHISILDTRLEYDKTNLQILNSLSANIKIQFLQIFNDLNEYMFQINRVILTNEMKMVLNSYYELSDTKHNRKIYKPDLITLKSDNLQMNNSKDSILINYCVTEKADGERYLLYICENRGYLISPLIYIRNDRDFVTIDRNLIIDTNLEFNGINGSVYDGEYITRDYDGNSIKKYMIFDIYYHNGESVYQLPFYLDGDFDDRFQRLHTFNFDENNHLDDNRCIDISIKEYYFGYQSDNIEEIKYEDIDYLKIFNESSKIWNMKSTFNYHIDGLIYLPTRLSVGSEYEGSPVINYNGRWKYNYKWKPPEENTIDFKIFIDKDENRKNKFYKYEDNDGIICEYNKIGLLVNYQYNNDLSNEFFRAILDNNYQKDKRKQKEILFQIPTHNKTGIKVSSDGKIYCKNGDEILDGMIVEMKYNNDVNQGLNNYWEPLRVRMDKMRGQNFDISLKIWDTIENPITTDMILQSKIPEMEDLLTNESNYYVNDEFSNFRLGVPLRKLHNYIKTKLIRGLNTSFSKKINVMDLSIGQGGDIHKYMDNHYKDFNIRFLFGLDISTNINEASRRYYDIQDKMKNKCVIIRSDTSKNIKNGESTEIDDSNDNYLDFSREMISILYNKNDTTKTYEQYRGLANEKFHVINSHFAMHYYFKNKDTFHGFIKNLNDNIINGGYFIGECYNGLRVFNELLKNNNEDIKYIDDFGNLIYMISKKYDLEQFDKDYLISNDKLFGNKIDVYMESIGQTITEYLVNFEYFIEVMEENNFKLVQKIPNIKKEYSNLFRSDYFTKDGLGSFERIIEKIPEINQSDTMFHKRYSEANEMVLNTELKLLSSLNNYFIFQKK